MVESQKHRVVQKQRGCFFISIFLSLFLFRFPFPVDVSVDGRPIGVTLCDTAGQDALDTLRQLCYPGSDVILLCFSVVQPDSFRSLATKWQPEISKLKGVSVVLVGTQSDLRNDQNTIGKLQVSGTARCTVLISGSPAATAGRVS